MLQADSPCGSCHFVAVAFPRGLWVRLGLHALTFMQLPKWMGGDHSRNRKAFRYIGFCEICSDSLSMPIKLPKMHLKDEKSAKSASCFDS